MHNCSRSLQGCNAHLPTSMAFATTFTGIGKQGDVFRLEATEVAALQTLVNALVPAMVTALRIGLSASASDATGVPRPSTSRRSRPSRCWRGLRHGGRHPLRDQLRWRLRRDLPRGQGRHSDGKREGGG